MPSDFSVVAIIAAYNEADIIEHVVTDLIDQGVQVCLLDDGSTDRTVAVVEPYLGRGVLSIERRADAVANPAQTPFEWERILRRKTELAASLDASWFIHHDADEFRESPWSHLSLRDAIQRVDALGYNAIDFAGFDFWPVHDRFRPGDDVRAVFTSCAQLASYDRLQIRCWKKATDLDLTSSGGHEARFPGRKVFPLRFILRHYPIRGQAHGERKIFSERRNRFLDRERARGWHVQYQGMQQGASFIRDPSTLTPYDPDAVRLALTLHHRSVEDLEGSVGELQAVVQAGRQELEQCRQDLAKACAALEGRRLESEAHLSGLAAHRIELERRNTELHARRAEVAALRDTIHSQEAELAGAGAENARLGDVLKERAAEIERWRRAVADLTGRLDAFWVRASGIFAHDLRIPGEWVQRAGDRGSLLVAGTRGEIKAYLGDESRARRR